MSTISGIGDLSNLDTEVIVQEGCALNVRSTRAIRVVYDTQGNLINTVVTYWDVDGTQLPGEPDQWALGPCANELTDVELITDIGCADGVEWTRVKRELYDAAGQPIPLAAEVWYLDADGVRQLNMPDGWRVGPCSMLYTTTVETIAGSTRTLITTLPDGSQLVAWSVRQRSGTVTVASSPLIDGSPAPVATLDAGETINFDAGDDKFGTMADSVEVDALSGSARVTYQYRKP